MPSRLLDQAAVVVLAVWTLTLVAVGAITVVRWVWTW